ncbi:MAG: response regulator, partial [Deltaproteobacteria bacterium]|nr:response regulator [Deltaproteobacteria bacterium]
VIGSNPRILKSGKHDASFYRDIWETITGGSVWQGRFINRKKDGTLYHEEATISPSRDTAGKIINFVAVKRDITNEIALENQLRHAQKMEAVGQLSGGVAHDFNNILTAIIGYASFLKMKMQKDDSLESYVANILASAERAADLTQGLLAFSRKQVTKLEPVNINAVVKRVGSLLMRLIGEDIDLRTEFSERDLVVMADSGHMEQVLVNLATNSRDAMPGGGVLSIKTEYVVQNADFIKTHGYGKPGEYALISATDTGMGMDRETMEKIFEPFFTKKEVGSGTGLGLAIVYGIVKQHGGYINVESEPGKGATFRIYLPLTEMDVEDVKKQESAVPLVGRETVLVAEDDPAVRRLIKSVLEKFGYRVLEAVDGEDAVAKFTENSGDIDLLILDVVMPRKNGKEVFDELKLIGSKVKVLFMSGYAADIVYRKGLVEEGLHLLSKPVSPGELLKSVRETLDS